MSCTVYDPAGRSAAAPGDGRGQPGEQVAARDPRRSPDDRPARPPKRSRSGCRCGRPGRSARPGRAPCRRRSRSGSPGPPARGRRTRPCARAGHGTGCSSEPAPWRRTAPAPHGWRRRPSERRPSGFPGPPPGPVRRPRIGPQRASCRRAPPEATGTPGDCQKPLWLLILLPGWPPLPRPFGAPSVISSPLVGRCSPVRPWSRPAAAVSPLRP